MLALSPYVAPFVYAARSSKLAAPVMYQGAQFDWGITPSLEGPEGRTRCRRPPKFLVKLKGGTHFEWTNLICVGQANVVACLKDNRNAYLIDLYGIEFLDRYLKDKPAPVLASGGRGLEKYEFDLRWRPPSADDEHGAPITGRRRPSRDNCGKDMQGVPLRQRARFGRCDV